MRRWFSRHRATVLPNSLLDEMKKKKTVVLEGNIGSGKSTLLENLKGEMENVIIRTEPIELWQNIAGINLLQERYEDPKKWSFLLQSYIQVTMARLQKEPIGNSTLLIERSIWSARYVFAEYLLEQQHITDVEMAVLDEWFKFIQQQEDMKIDLIIYLEVSPEECLSRIKKREETTVKQPSLLYLKRLQELYSKWLQKQEHPVMYITEATTKEDIKNEIRKLWR